MTSNLAKFLGKFVPPFNQANSFETLLRHDTLSHFSFNLVSHYIHFAMILSNQKRKLRPFIVKKVATLTWPTQESKSQRRPFIQFVWRRNWVFLLTKKEYSLKNRVVTISYYEIKNYQFIKKIWFVGLVKKENYKVREIMWKPLVKTLPKLVTQ